MSDEITYTVEQVVRIKDLNLPGAIKRIASGGKVRRWPYLILVPGHGIRSYGPDDIEPYPPGEAPVLSPLGGIYP